MNELQTSNQYKGGLKMKKMNFKWLVVLCMAMGFATVAKAQIYSSEDCFYAKAGSSSVSYVVKFEYAQDKVWLKSVSHSTVRTNLAKSEDFYEDEIWTDGKNSVSVFEYDSQKSTSAREVYKKKVKRSGNQFLGYGFGGVPLYNSIPGYRYVAFSKDMSSFIMWCEDENNYNGEIRDKKDYTRVPKEDLLPKAANYDFLND